MIAIHSSNDETVKPGGILGTFEENWNMLAPRFPLPILTSNSLLIYYKKIHHIHSYNHLLDLLLLTYIACNVARRNSAKRENRSQSSLYVQETGLNQRIYKTGLNYHSHTFSNFKNLAQD